MTGTRPLVLIADDNLQNLAVLRYLLEASGLRVLSAENGAEALERALRDPPAILVTDILMPVMDGFTLCRRWQQHDRLKTIPLVFYSANYADGRDREFAMRLGAARFIVKPEEPERLLSIIRETIDDYAARAPAPPAMLDEEAFRQMHERVVIDKLELKVRELEEEISRRRAAERNIRDLARRLAEVQEDERRVISRELHDRVGTNLSALALSLRVARTQLAADSVAALGTRLDDAQILLRQSIADIRDVMAELRPPALDDYGLAAALRAHACRVSTRTAIPIVVSGDDHAPRPDIATETALFRIAQEALMNVLKHASASRVDIHLRENGGRLTLTVRDDGKGMAADSHTAATSSWGLKSMRERAESIGGDLHIESEPGCGTLVSVQLPTRTA